MLLALAVAVLVSCGQTSTQIQPVPAAGPVSSDGSGHILVATELIEIKVFQEPDLSTVNRIPDDGRITMPMIGEIAIAGMSVQDATSLIRQRLEARFVAHPQVSLTVTERARKLFTILGQVNRAGTYKFPDRESLNLIQAIGIAGGYTPIADPTRITLKRVLQGRPSVLKLDARRMASDSSNPVEIESGDIITVGERLF